MRNELKTFLLDADGVVQNMPPGWLDRVKATMPESRREESKQFLHDLFAAEKPAVAGDSTLIVALQPFIAAWEVEDTQALLAIWHDIEVDRDVLQAIKEAQAAGHRVCLATNQHDHRTGFMRDIYDGIFDHDFYSGEMGAAKPHAAYFNTILATLDLTADDVVFFDDTAANIEGAEALGIESVFVARDAEAASLIRAKITTT